MQNDKAETQQKVKQKKKRRKLVKRLVLVCLLALVIGLGAILYGPVRTMASLERVDDYPLFVMRYHGTYFFDWFSEHGIDWPLFKKFYKAVNPDACTSFAALNNENNAVFGRNFDWQHRSSLLLFTDPPGGYSSVSMVDLYYYGLEGMQEIPWKKRLNLLGTPYAVMDGMNEWGVAVSQNAVPIKKLPYDPNKPTLISNQLMRAVLDHARDVNEAIALIQKYNPNFPVIYCHIHIADVSGNSVVVEYVDGRMVLVRNDKPWQVSTNFLISQASTESAESKCWRFDLASEQLGQAEGQLTQDEAMKLLQSVKLSNTTWSVVYNLSTGAVMVAVGQDYEQIHTFRLRMRNRRN
ncbi:MAG: linear amide C-N hydrolase [Sedimentisphaerales bacterium]|nr:linear amide C-N hydrolase [Sedimentisphaerales bacterium]